jgi:carbon storage regulator
VLVLTRKIGERIVIANHIVIEVVALQGRQVRLGIEAPPGVAVLREELIAAEQISDQRASTN